VDGAAGGGVAGFEAGGGADGAELAGAVDAGGVVGTTDGADGAPGFAPAPGEPVGGGFICGCPGGSVVPGRTGIMPG